MIKQISDFFSKHLLLPEDESCDEALARGPPGSRAHGKGEEARKPEGGDQRDVRDIEPEGKQHPDERERGHPQGSGALAWNLFRSLAQRSASTTAASRPRARCPRGTAPRPA